VWLLRPDRSPAKPKGRGSAAEVVRQIQQALGGAFTDPADLSTRHVTKCWVVTSHDIKKEAAESIKSALGTRVQEGVVRLVPGDGIVGTGAKAHAGQGTARSPSSGAQHP
jgi:hypothetical protein